MSKRELFRFLDRKCANLLNSIAAYEDCGRSVKELWYAYDVLQNLIIEIDGNFGNSRMRGNV